MDIGKGKQKQPWACHHLTGIELDSLELTVKIIIIIIIETNLGPNVVSHWKRWHQQSCKHIQPFIKQYNLIHNQGIIKSPNLNGYCGQRFSTWIPCHVFKELISESDRLHHLQMWQCKERKILLHRNGFSAEEISNRFLQLHVGNKYINLSYNFLISHQILLVT